MLPITIGSTIRTSIRIRKVDWFIYTREPTSDLDVETGVQRADDISAAETPTEQQAIAEEEDQKKWILRKMRVKITIVRMGTTIAETMETETELTEELTANLYSLGTA